VRRQWWGGGCLALLRSKCVQYGRRFRHVGRPGKILDDPSLPCRLVAQRRPPAMSARCPLSRETRTFGIARKRSEFDLGCVKTCERDEAAELFSLLSSPDVVVSAFAFSNRLGGDKISIRKFNFRVFTQPRPISDIHQPNGCLRFSPAIAAETTTRIMAHGIPPGSASPWQGRQLFAQSILAKNISCA
jgi:hypothetical protein